MYFSMNSVYTHTLVLIIDGNYLYGKHVGIGAGKFSHTQMKEIAS